MNSSLETAAGAARLRDEDLRQLLLRVAAACAGAPPDIRARMARGLRAALDLVDDSAPRDEAQPARSLELTQSLEEIAEILGAAAAQAGRLSALASGVTGHIERAEFVAEQARMPLRRF